MPRLSLHRPRPTPARADAGGPPPRGGTRLGTAIRRQQLRVQRDLDAMGPDEVDRRLQDALDVPSAHALAAAVDAVLSSRGAPALIVEAAPSRDPRDVAASVAALVAAGADAVVVTAPGVADAAPGGRAAAASPDDEADAAAAGACLLAAVAAARGAAPVLLRDWIVHPLQLADAKAAGAAGALGAAAAVLGRGAPTLTSFGAAMGLDVPLEVVNDAEAAAAAAAGVPLLAVNVSLALSLGGVPGAAASVARGVLAGLPPGAAALVGVDSLDDAAAAAGAGAAAVVVKAGAIDAAAAGGGGVAGAVAAFREAVALSD